MATNSDDPNDPLDKKDAGGFSEASARFDAGAASAATLLARLAHAVQDVKDGAVLHRTLEGLAREAASADAAGPMSGQMSGPAPGQTSGPISGQAPGVANSSVHPMVALLDADLVLRTAAPSAQAFFSAAPGDALANRIENYKAALERLNAEGDTTLINFSATDGRRYPAALRRLADADGAAQYRLAVHRLQLSNAVKTALRKHYRLSASEMSVIEGIMDRRTAQEIAIERDVQKSTVTSQIHNIVKKLASDNITDATLQIASLITADPSDLPSPSSETPLAAGDKVIELKTLAASIHYRKMGETGGAPILILHGLFDAAPPPERFARDLVRRGFCPYFIYRPGFARSTPLDADKEIAAAIDGFAQRVLTAPAILVGLHEAQDLAARLILEPGSLGARGRRGGGLRGAVIAGVEDWTSTLAARSTAEPAQGAPSADAIAALVDQALAYADPSAGVSTIYGRARFEDEALLKVASDGLSHLPAVKQIAQDLSRRPVDARSDAPAPGPTARRRRAGGPNIVRLAPLAHRLALYADPTPLIDALETVAAP